MTETPRTGSGAGQQSTEEPNRRTLQSELGTLLDAASPGAPPTTRATPAGATTRKGIAGAGTLPMHRAQRETTPAPCVGTGSSRW